MSSSDGEFTESCSHLRDFLSAEVSIDQLRLAREHRTLRTAQSKAQIACAAAPITAVNGVADSGNTGGQNQGRATAKSKKALKTTSEVLDSDYSEESEDLSEGTKSPARNMNMTKDKRMQTRRALKWGPGKDRDVGSTPCPEHDDPSESSTFSDTIVELGPPVAMSDSLLDDTIVELGPPATPAELLAHQLKTEAWISPPAEEHPDLVMQFPAGPPGQATVPVRKIPQLPALGPSASLWRQRGFPEHSAQREGRRHAEDENNALDANELDANKVADRAVDEHMQMLEPAHWRSRQPKFKNHEDQHTYSEFVDVSNPYVRALRAHREEIMRNTMDLQDMSVDSLPSRLATQRSDALATLKAHPGQQAQHTERLIERHVLVPICGPTRCGDEDCMGGRDGGNMELLFLEPVHEDAYRPHSFGEGFTPRLPNSARGTAEMPAGTEELINRSVLTEAVDKQSVDDSSWKDVEEHPRLRRVRGPKSPGSRDQASKEGASLDCRNPEVAFEYSHVNPLPRQELL